MPTALTRHVALLRGINVGKAKRVAMADLRALLEGLGYSDVKTLLNSGNVVFACGATPKGDHGARIQKAIESKLGVTSRVIVLTAKEVAEIMDGNPIAKLVADDSRGFVSVLADAADRKKLVPLAKEDWSPDSLALGIRVAYTWCPNGLLESRAQEALGKALRDAVTTRNWATMKKLHALLAEK